MEQQKINIKASDDDLKGRYANNAMVSHTKEEFVFDFMNILPPGGLMIGRIIVSPGHAKRIAKALTEQIERYEASHGKLETSDEPANIGFRSE
jgi:hypothetical protein